ncbi:prenyltransferase/squalene oxidase repeat-containing protein [Nocardioides sp. L-11A]|uniref:prenyltransferase/squalene oxidase repeat-containing protein n=1 Tax=Nocardioides sp. L-11A TaxID=3043848 RepID=UPI00249C0F20|nr:terpene cyclase/mutase family protein [Nocardioides sp. L-11A]
MSPRSLVRRTVAAVAGTAVVAGGLMAVAPAPSAHADSVAPNAAANWLVGELDATGLLHGDVAKTIDFALALKEIGGHQATLAKIASGVDGKLDAYAVDGVSYAQASLFYRAVGVDPATKAGNLVTKLEGAVDDTSGEMVYPWGGAWSQALAVRALDAANSTETDDATDSLIDDFECPSGGWGYWDGAHTSCTADPDNTADMLFALLPQKGKSAKIDDAIARGISWLKAAQKADGSFEAYEVNASSTGLAGQALARAGAAPEAERAALWLRGRQVAGSSCDGKLAAEGGAVGFSDQVVAEGRTDGIDPAAPGTGYDWYLATAQSIVALKAAPIGGPLAVTPLFVHVSSTVNVAATGLAVAENACLTIGATSTPLRGGATTATSFVAPVSAQAYPVTLVAPGRSFTASLKALDATKLKIKVATKIKAKKKATIKVKGLAAGEPVTVKVGKKTATGTANAKGVAKVKVKVKKKGKAKVKVVGAFPDRKGKATTRVR